MYNKCECKLNSDKEHHLCGFTMSKELFFEFIEYEVSKRMMRSEIDIRCRHTRIVAMLDDYFKAFHGGDTSVYGKQETPL